MEFEEEEDTWGVEPDWLQKVCLVKKLVAKLDPKLEGDGEMHANAACALVDAVVKSGPNVPSAQMVMQELQTKEVLDVLFEHMFSGSASSLTHTLSVVIVLVQSYTDRRLQEKHEGLQEESLDEEMKIEEKKAKQMETATEVAPVIQHVVQALPQLLTHLTNPTPSTMLTQYGELNPPVGPARLKIVELVLALVQSVAEDADCEQNEAATLVTDILVQTNAFSYVLDLFFQYPWNNMLHGLGEGIIHTVMDSANDDSQGEGEMENAADAKQAPNSLMLRLNQALFVETDLLARIMKGFELNNEALSVPKGCRLGYMGHLLRICAIIVESYPSEKFEALKVPVTRIPCFLLLFRVCGVIPFK